MRSEPDPLDTGQPNSLDKPVRAKGDNTMYETIIEECKNCDSTIKGYPYGKDESLHCLSCGAEWEGVKVKATISFCHVHQETLINGEPCYTCMSK